MKADAEKEDTKMMALNINQLALATGGNTTPFGIGMPTPMDDTRQRIDEQVKKGPCPIVTAGPPGPIDIFWTLFQLGYV